jgi:hypothetical protein
MAKQQTFTITEVSTNEREWLEEIGTCERGALFLGTKTDVPVTAGRVHWEDSVIFTKESLLNFLKWV